MNSINDLLIIFFKLVLVYKMAVFTAKIIVSKDNLIFLCKCIKQFAIFLSRKVNSLFKFIANFISSKLAKVPEQH